MKDKSDKSFSLQCTTSVINRKLGCFDKNLNCSVSFMLLI